MKVLRESMKTQNASWFFSTENRKLYLVKGVVVSKYPETLKASSWHRAGFGISHSQGLSSQT